MTTIKEPPRLLDDDQALPELKTVLRSADDDDPTPLQLAELGERLADIDPDRVPTLPALVATPLRKPNRTKWIALAAAVACLAIGSATVLMVASDRWGDDDEEMATLRLEPVNEGTNPPVSREAPLTQPAPPVPSVPPAPPFHQGERILRESPRQATTMASFDDVLDAYRSGDFDEARRLAQQRAASTNYEDERRKALSLDHRIGRFAKAWSRASWSQTRHKMNNLESALRLDRQISGGHYAPQIRSLLKQTYLDNADRTWRAKQFASSCQSGLRALKLDKTDSKARSAIKRCETKAREFYNVGQKLASNDLSRAKSYWRKVLNMVSRTNPYYGKAYSALNDAARSEDNVVEAGSKSASTSEALQQAKAAVLRGDQAGCIKALKGAPRTGGVVRTLWYCYYMSGNMEQACNLGKSYERFLNQHQKRAIMARCR